MTGEISQPKGTLVRVYLNRTKGQTFKDGSSSGKVISFKGTVHEITKDSLILKGRFMWNGWIEIFGKFPSKISNPSRKPQIMCRKFKKEDIMRVMKIEE